MSFAANTAKARAGASRAMKSRRMAAVETFVIALRAETGVDAIHALRGLLKRALRVHKLRCIAAIEIHETGFAITIGAGDGKISSAPEKGVEAMDMAPYSGAAFLKIGDIKTSGPVKAVIKHIELGKYDKPDVTFEDGSRLSLNATNNKTLCRAFGADSDGWIGQEIELRVGEIEFKGTPQEAILVKPILPPIKKKKAKNEDDELSGPAPF